MQIFDILVFCKQGNHIDLKTNMKSFKTWSTEKYHNALALELSPKLTLLLCRPIYVHLSRHFSIQAQCYLGILDTRHSGTRHNVTKPFITIKHLFQLQFLRSNWQNAQRFLRESLKPLDHGRTNYNFPISLSLQSMVYTFDVSDFNYLILQDSQFEMLKVDDTRFSDITIIK